MWCVRRALALSWALGTSAGVLLGLFAVQLVTSGITGGRISPLSRPEVLQALSAGNTDEAPEAPEIAAPPATPDTGSAPPLPDPVSKPAPTPPASAPPRPGATAGPTTTTTKPPPPPAPPTTAAPPPAPPPAAAPPEPPKSTTTTAPRGETHTITSRGGTVAAHYEDGKVRLLWARPNSGYDVVVVHDGPERVYVRFRDGGSRSHVYAFYRDGKPAEEVVERGRKDDGDSVDSRTYEPVRQESGWDDAEWWQDEWSQHEWWERRQR